MLHEFSFDKEHILETLKISALVVVIFVSGHLSAREGTKLIETVGISNTIKRGMPAIATTTPKISAATSSPAHFFRKINLPQGVPVVEGAAAIAAGIETGAVLFEKNKDDMYPTASLAKLMTAVIAQETLASSTIITSGSEAISTYGNSGGIVGRESFREDDLLYGLLLPSSNDAARMIELSQKNFVPAMNKKASELGMTHTHYADSSGLTPDTTSSVSDLVKLLQYIYANHPDIMAVSRTREHVAVSGGRKLRHIWDNVNWPAGDSKFLAGKAGFTDEAMSTMAGIWLINPLKSGARPIAIVVLGTHQRVSDVRSIVRLSLIHI